MRWCLKLAKEDVQRRLTIQESSSVAQTENILSVPSMADKILRGQFGEVMWSVLAWGQFSKEILRNKGRTVMVIGEEAICPTKKIIPKTSLSVQLPLVTESATQSCPHLWEFNEQGQKENQRCFSLLPPPSHTHVHVSYVHVHRHTHCWRVFQKIGPLGQGIL